MKTRPSVGDDVYIVVMTKDKVIRGKVSSVIHNMDSSILVEVKQRFSRRHYIRKLECVWTSKKEAVEFYKTNKMVFAGQVK